jgi:hypothetical protein
MKLEKIVTSTNEKFKLQFLAMERSLRATGCDLPIWVIPFDQTRFDLPSNSIWWDLPELRHFLAENRATPLTPRYYCLTISNYQFVDADVIFLRNPAIVLADQEGFVASCGHWSNPAHCYTADSLRILKRITTRWPARVFNAGQFACDQALYTVEKLKQTCLDPLYANTCFNFDQCGTVLLANLSQVRISNLTLPPVNMESTWAGSYEDDNFEKYWTEESRKPYLLHWAGVHWPVPVDRLFTDFLTPNERQIWAAQAEQKFRKRRSLMNRLRKVRDASRNFLREIGEIRSPW